MVFGAALGFVVFFGFVALVVLVSTITNSLVSFLSVFCFCQSATFFGGAFFVLSFLGSEIGLLEVSTSFKPTLFRSTLGNFSVFFLFGLVGIGFSANTGFSSALTSIGAGSFSGFSDVFLSEDIAELFVVLSLGNLSL